MKLRGCLVVSLVFLAVMNVAMAEEYVYGRLVKTGDWKGERIEYVDGMINVMLKSGHTKSSLSDYAARNQVTVVREPDRFGFMQLHCPDADRFFRVIREFSSLEAVEWAEPDMVMRAFATPNDPLFSTQWHYHNIGQSPPEGTEDADIDCPEAWEFTTGESQIMVGVLDTGIPMQDGELSHPDLDDPARFILGLNVFTGDLDPMDDNGHGTHVSGTIGAETNNNTGVSGINWNCKIMALKVFNAYGSGSTSGLRDAAIYAVDNGCKVLNYSGGGSGSASSEHAVAYADSHGVVFCAAAGNSYGGSVLYPAAYSVTYDNVIAVSSTDHNDELAQYSNVGPEVVISAPGGYGSPFNSDDVQSTFPNYTCYLVEEYGLPTDYAPLAGTSMACPHASGVASLILSVDPTLTPLQVRDLLIQTSVDLGDPGFDVEFGHGRISALNAMLQMGEINIGHQPLTDTKNSIDDYRVDCQIFSVAPLVPSELLLHYNTGFGWQELQLIQDRATSAYYQYIPAQSPGSTVEYYLYAQNSDGVADTTSTYSFEVIDYRVILEPWLSESIAAGLDTAWYTLTVTNDGVYFDHFDLTYSGNSWNTSLWNEFGTSMISQTSSLAPDQTYDFLVRVVVPESVIGETDNVTITAASDGDPSETASVTCETMSSGVPLDLPFSESFDDLDLDPAIWITTYGVEVTDEAQNLPSEPYCLNFDGSPTMVDTLISQAIRLSGYAPMTVKFSYQRGGTGEQPDNGDDFTLEYMNSSAEWIHLYTILGSGPSMNSFDVANVSLPSEAMHDGFRLRFRNSASGVERDDWFIDDISLEWAPQIDVTINGSLDPVLDPDDIYGTSLTIQNVGLSLLQYEIEVVPDYSQAGAFGDLYSEGLVDPPYRDYPPDYNIATIVKGSDDYRQGANVVFNAGGPDDYGYVWIDSDEPTGPAFSWIDISGSGIQVTGLIDDGFAGPFPIGFDFEFYGETYTEFYVSSNGFIGFGPSENYYALANSPLPAFDVPNNIVALLWDDLNIEDADNPGAEVRYANVGSSLVIQYVNMPEYGADPGDVFSGEILLQQDGSIKLQYLDFGSGFDTEHCTVGIEDADGFRGLEVAFNTSYLHDSLCIVINEPSLSWLAVSPSSGELEDSESENVTLNYSSSGVAGGSYHAEIRIHSNDPHEADNPWIASASMTVQVPYSEGDANGDSSLDIDDIVFMIAFVFNGGPAPQPVFAADANCSGGVDVDDVVYLINHIFQGGAAPCAGY